VTYTVTAAQTVTGCAAQEVYTIIAKDSCGNTATQHVTYTWTANTTPPVITVPPGGPLACNATPPSCASVSNTVTVSASCGSTVTFTVTSAETVNGCSAEEVYTIIAKDSCGNTATQHVTYTWTVNTTPPTVTCPPNVTIFTNLCQMYCTFAPADWNGSCDGGSRYGGSWWQSWCGQNPTTGTWSSWTGWWGSCGASSGQYNNWWNNWSASLPTSCWGSWSSSGGGGSWWGSWSGGSGGSKSWVPCGGNNPDTILNNCFSQVYPSGSTTIGLPGSGYCVTLNSCSAIKTCLGITGNPGCLNGNLNNPSSCSAGSFCAQVLALQLNCNFGDYGCVPGFVGKCGDLVLCDSTSPCYGMKVRDILTLCNRALGGGACPPGCTPAYLNTLCSNLNQCFEGCQVSGWCGTHLCSVYIPLPAQTGTATVTTSCGASETLTYTDTVSTGSCAGTYVINREWVAVDACGNTGTCTQVITVIAKCQTGQVCSSFNSENPSGGYVWCNAHLTCNPGKACTIYCQNASVTLTCSGGKTYTYPVPNGQINFSPSCTSASCSFNGTSWTTTLPCGGDSQIFLAGCGIPWQSAFANCKSVCWTGTFACSTTGVNCDWQWSAACYNCNLGNCGSINVKACQQTACGYNNSDCAGTPENFKSYCQGGGCGTGGGNYCGSWSNSGSCDF
jgi:hypothetical protein